MGFGTEMKDFISAFRGVSSTINDTRRVKAYEDDIASRGDRGGFDFGNAKGANGKYWNNSDEPVKPGKKRHSPLHNFGHFLGLNDDDHDKPAGAIPTRQGFQGQISPYMNRDTSTLEDGYDEDLGYSRGGVVRPKRYALGGPVAPEPVVDEEDTTYERPAAPPPPSRAALPVQTASAERAAVSPETDGAGETPDALHAGIMQLQKNFGLDRKNPAVGMDHERIAGQKALMNSIGRPSDHEMDEASKLVGADRHLDKAKTNLQIMEQGYEWYLGHGDIDKANNFAASIIQYATYEAGKFGAAALDDLRRGDIQSAAANTAAGYDSLPNGYHVTQQVNDDGTISVQKVDTKTDKVVGEHTLTAQQLYQAALSLNNKSGSWDALMEAAASRRGLGKPPAKLNDADVEAIASVHGMNADGSPVQSRPTMSGQTPDNGPAGPTISEVGDQPTEPAQHPDVKAAIDSMPEYQRQYATVMARKEAQNDPNASSKASGGKAVGLFQFTPETWQQATGEKIDPKVIGTDQDPRRDPKKSAAAMRTLTAQNETAFRKKFDRDPTPQDLAVMHQQGTTGGLKLLSANPEDRASKYVSVAALKQNGVSPKATAGEAVAAIKAYYFGKGSAKSNDPLAVQPMLDEDRGDPAPELAMPSQPQWAHPDADKMEKMTPEGHKIYMQQIREKNLEMQKQYAADSTAAQGKFKADTAAHTAALKAARADALKPIPTKDRIDVIDKLTSAEENRPEIKALFGAEGDGAGRPTLEDVRPIAYELFTRNDIPDTTAYQLATQLSDPKTKNFSLHKTSRGVFRLVTPQGKFTLTPNALAEVAAVRGKLLSDMRESGAKSAAKSERRAKTWEAGKEALGAAGNIVVGGVKAADKAVGALLTPGTPEKIYRGTRTALGNIADATARGAQRGADILSNETFVNKSNRR